jgi:uncharacterized membrane protein HdeD (DUF308 family)
VTRAVITRANVVERLENRLRAESFPRLVMTAVVSIAGGVAFLCSVVTLSAGVDSMAVRYGLAAVAGYVVFGGVLRAWIGWRRSWLDHVVDLPTPDFDLDVGRAAGSSSTLFSGGRSGGGGASASFSPGPTASTVSADANAAHALPMPGSSEKEGGWFKVIDPDADERIWFVVLAIVLAFSALIAVAFVVYSAPVLMAEVALGAGVMSGVYRSVRRHDDGHWVGAVWRRTWLPALLVIASVSVAGYLLQIAVPEANSIGDVIRALSE